MHKNLSKRIKCARLEFASVLKARVVRSGMHCLHVVRLKIFKFVGIPHNSSALSFH